MKKGAASGYGYQVKRITRRGINYIKRNGLLAAVRRVGDKSKKSRLYEEWRQKHALSEAALCAQREEAAKLSKKWDSLQGGSGKPLFSMVIPLYMTEADMLRQLVSSWRAQTYSDFEVCLADASCDDEFERLVRDTISTVAPGDRQRFRYLRLPENKGISENTNAAIEMAAGEFIVFCDHDDTVSADVLYEMARAIDHNPETDVVYTNQDKVDSVGKRYYDPFVKPDYDPVLLLATNYICHLHAIRRSLLDEVGLLNGDYDGSQDYEITLRACERARAVAHINKMSYHWRISGNSTADEGDQKLYAYDAGKRAIEAHYRRLGIDAKVSMREDTYGVYRTSFRLPADWMHKVAEVEVREGLPDIDALSELIDTGSFEYVLFKRRGLIPPNADCIPELAGYVICAGADGCGAIPEYPFQIPVTGMRRVDISTFYLTVCPSQSMPVSADLLFARMASLPVHRDFYKTAGWQNRLGRVVYDPYAFPVDPIKI